MSANEADSDRWSRVKKLDPRVAALIQEWEERDSPPLESLTPIQVREAINAVIRESGGNAGVVSKIQDLSIPGNGGQIPIRIYTPGGGNSFPILLYLHGGGWTFGSLDTHNNICCTLSSGASCVVASVDYRLAPEHKFPAAVEDAYAAAHWVRDNAGRIGGDPSRIAVGGDSSGGNLATALTLLSRDRKGPYLVHQMLVNPATNLSAFDTKSYREFAEGYVLTRAEMEWYRGNYLEKEEDWLNPYASPLLADDLSDLPPAFVVTSEFDVLRDEGKAYADRLREAGVPVRYTCVPGMIHFGVLWCVASDIIGDAIDEAVAALCIAFEK